MTKTKQPEPQHAPDDMEPVVGENDTFADHLRKQFTYLHNLDTHGRQLTKLTNFYQITLYGLAAQSVPLNIGGDCRAVKAWSKLRVIFKTIVCKSAKLQVVVSIPFPGMVMIRNRVREVTVFRNGSFLPLLCPRVSATFLRMYYDVRLARLVLP